MFSWFVWQPNDPQVLIQKGLFIIQAFDHLVKFLSLVAVEVFTSARCGFWCRLNYWCMLGQRVLLAANLAEKFFAAHIACKFLFFLLVLHGDV